MGAFIFLLIFTIAGYILGEIIDYEGWLGFFLGMFLWLIFIAIMSGVSVFSSEVIGEPWEVEQYKIQGLESNIETKQETFGAFVLGCGFVNSDSDTDLKYYYFKVDEIGKQLESIEIDKTLNTYIRETDNVEPCLIYRYEKRRDTGFCKWLFGGIEMEHKVAEILVVPTNTIKIEYNVDI
jgi:hypothetical protein